VNFVLPGFFPTLQTLFGQITDLDLLNVSLPNVNLPNLGLPNLGLPDLGLPDLGLPGLTSTTSPITSTLDTLTPNNQQLITLDVTPQQGVDRGKGAATDLAQLPTNAADALEKTAAGATNAAGGPLGAVEDTLTTTTSKGPQVRSSLKFVPEIKASGKGGSSGGGSNGQRHA
jgi:hypothetical protein